MFTAIKQSNRSQEGKGTFDVLTDLENALIDLGSIAQVLMAIGEYRDELNDAALFNYLGAEVSRQERQGYAAFRILHKVIHCQRPEPEAAVDASAAAPSEFERLFAELVSLGQPLPQDDAEFEAMGKQQVALEETLLKMPARTLGDLLVKARVMRRIEVSGSLYEPESQPGQFLVADLERMAGEA